MPVRPIVSRPLNFPKITALTFGRNISNKHRLLLASVSTVAMLTVSPNVHAKPMGGWTATPSVAAIAAAQSGSQEAARAARDGANALKRATLAIQAMQATQAAARDAARAQLNTMPNMVPNGLRPGGLQIGAGVIGTGGSVNPNLWQGAKLPAESVDGDRTKVGIEQTQQKAILTWDTFNIGGKTDLTFDQKGNANWVALNRVLGTDAKPSQILGNIKADGQVYIINQNGIIFGGASQVNVGALIASTASISNAQFLNNGIYSPAGSYEPSFTGAGGAVTVEAGAQIATHAPSSVTTGGGFVALLGSSVVNDGSIATPKGQALLAAGDDFVLRRGYGTDANSFSTTRGNEIVPIIHDGSLSGGVTNNGLIFSQQGDITLAGRTIAQNGILVSTTSVNTRGTIHLLNSAADTQGSVTLGADSLTDILIELESADTALNSQRDALIAESAKQNGMRLSADFGIFDNLSKLSDRLDQSRVEIVTGGNVLFEGGSLTIAQGGQVAVSAGGRIFTENGATIDVSGVRDVLLPMSANNIMVNIQGNELRDSPQNRDNDYLKNADVWIDIRNLIFVPAGTGGYAADRYYTPGGLLEVGGHLANTAHKIGEWASLGGTITLNASEVIAQQGSVFDISGGSVRYDGGNIVTTNFLGSDGRTYNINSARGDMTFYGLGQGWIRKSERWGVTEVWTSPLGRGRETVRWEDGYTVGRDAGKLILSTPTSIFEGEILADTVTGEHQINTRPSRVTDGYKLGQTQVALNGTLALGQYDALGLKGAYNTAVVFGDIADITSGLDASSALPGDRANTAWFDATHLNEQGLGGLTIATRDTVTIDAPIVMADGGNVSLTASIVDIKADIVARSGSVAIGNILRGMSTIEALKINDIANATLHSGATIDTRGLWTNALLEPGDLSGRAYVDGGKVSFESTKDVVLLAGSVIDASSGAALQSNGKLVGGKGGDISLVADVFLGDEQAGGDVLTLAGTLRSYGVTKGGALTIGAPSVLIANGTTSATPGQLVLSSSFFQQGFSKYQIGGDSGVEVAPGTEIDVIQPVYRLTDRASATPTGSDPNSALAVWTPPLYLENAQTGELIQRGGASLSLVSSGEFGTGVVVGRDAVVRVDAGQSVSVSTRQQITIDGTIEAHGGAITLNNNQPDTVAGLSIWLGEHAKLDVSARAVVALYAQGHRYGVVPGGGSIEINGGNAFVVIRPGAVLEASGTSATLDIPVGGLQQAGTPINVASNGGSVSLQSKAGLYLDGMLSAAAGGAGASGGTLSVALDTRLVAGSLWVPPDNEMVPRYLTISQNYVASGLRGDLLPGDVDDSLAFGQARISAEQVASGGFDSLSLKSFDMFMFEGAVSLKLGRSVSFYTGALVSSNASSAVTINAPYVLFQGGGVEDRPSQVSTGTSPKVTSATLTVTADLIDIQNEVQFGKSGAYQLSTLDPNTWLPDTRPFDEAGFASVDLTSRGDIRFLLGKNAAPTGNPPVTSLRTPGNLTLIAAQLYPTIGADARVYAAYDASMPDAKLIIKRISDVMPQTPFSVFGKLALYAPAIDQGGIIRAPLGEITLGGDQYSGQEPAREINLLPGSITSVSAAGLIIPYGGTADGVTYKYNGVDVSFGPGDQFRAGGAITMQAQSVVGHGGSTLDLSGGGILAGAAFISGRGGSVDVLTTQLVNSNPANTFSASGNGVYAIVPGYASGYAPVDAGAGAAPGIGQQITIPAGVPGLPAGTYTLLPARYALVPGAFRVELGNASRMMLPGAVAAGGGSYVVSGTTGVANTSIKTALPTQIIVTPGTTVRRHSQYNETTYDQFAIQKAATLGQARPALVADAKTLNFIFYPGKSEAFSFEGKTLFQPAEGGWGGVANIDVEGDGADVPLEVFNLAPTEGYRGVSVRASALNALNAARLSIGGHTSFLARSPTVIFDGNAQIVDIRNGVYLRAPEIFLIAKDYTPYDEIAGGFVNVEAGARIETIGMGRVPYDSSNGFIYDSGGTTVIAVSNGWLNFMPPPAAPGGINIGLCPSGTCSEGARIVSDGTLTFVTGGDLQFAENFRYGAKYLSLAVPTINIGDAATLANAAVPNGLRLDQSVLNRLLAGDPSLGAPKLERLTLGASQSINFYGSVDLNTIDPATGKSYLDALVLNTPAIYGYGSEGDAATITAGTLYWNGVFSGAGSATPGAVMQNGPGTGSGSFNVNAERIVFGYADTDRKRNDTVLDRLALGFSTVNLTATDRITANAKGSLSVYQSQGDYVEGSGYAYSEGTLNLITPLLTGEAGSVNSINAGRALILRSPAGATAASVGSGNLGAEIHLSAASITQFDTTIALPSGRLTMTATEDILLTSQSRIDAAGREVKLFDQTRYSWGGDVVLVSKQGNVVQQSGSVIDVSAVNNDAGTVSVQALGSSAGHVDLAGLIKGSSTGSYDAGGGAIVPYDMGGVDIRAESIADFAGLNLRLTDSGVTGSRTFVLKQGNLTVGNEIKAREVTISVDGGSLTVNGRIDASGAEVGTIRLSARDDLRLASGSMLDAHGAVLRVDSYGKPIDATNRAIVELTTSQGWLRLDPGAAIDVRSADTVARGTIELNARRLGSATSGDIAIAAAGPLAIRGAKSIAVNGFWTYTDAPVDTNPTASGRPNQIITQDYLDRIHAQDSVPFIDNAWANADLQGRLSGLKAYDDAFHLRPGVEIRSATENGDLTVQGDVDLAGYRYGSSVNPGVHGSGEPGMLVIRAGGDLNIYGSITDGFSKPLATPDDSRWLLLPDEGLYMPPERSVNVGFVLPIGVTLAAGTQLAAPNGWLSFDLPLGEMTVNPNAVIPTQVTLANSFTVPANGLVATATIRLPSGQTFTKGQIIPGGTELPPGSTLAAGTKLSGQAIIQPMIWPAGSTINIFNSGVALGQDTAIPAGTVIASGSVLTGFVTYENGERIVSFGLPSRMIGADGTQGKIWAAAPLLPAGSLSWSMRLAAGADLAAADTRTLRADKTGDINLSDKHYTGTIQQPMVIDPNNPYEVDPNADPRDWCPYIPEACIPSGEPPKFVASSTVSSVLRTGTGDLELLAGGNYTQYSSYGVYTAGTQAPAIDPKHQRPRGVTSGTNPPISPDYQANYPEQGGNVLLSVTGNIVDASLNSSLTGNGVGNWLWRQGGDIVGQSTAWWINFGSYVQPTQFSPVVFAGFTGLGALGGGNVTVLGGGDIGSSVLNLGGYSTSLDVAVGSTGRVTSVIKDGNIVTGGTLDLTGGGDITIKIAGGYYAGISGAVTNLRGNIDLHAGSIGSSMQGGQPTIFDPRAPDPLIVHNSYAEGLTLVQGDGAAHLSTLRDLVLNGAGDPGRLPTQNTTPFTYTASDGTQMSQAGGGNTTFSLWTPTTSIDLFSAGGNLVPVMQYAGASEGVPAYRDQYYAPPIFRVVAANGSIYGQGSVELAPSPVGQLELLARGSIYANGSNFSMSGAPSDYNSISNPFKPLFVGLTDSFETISNGIPGVQTGELFAFALDTPTTLLHANDSVPIRFYAAEGDMIGLQTGSVYNPDPFSGTASFWYRGAAKPIRMLAGRDIVSTGLGEADFLSPEVGGAAANLIGHNNPTDVSVVSAGRDIIYASFNIVGPGLLDITAGRNVYQGDKGVLHSLGRIVDVDSKNHNGGAGITVTAGVGKLGRDYTGFADLYFNSANLADPNQPLADQPGKVVQSYSDELFAWLQGRFGSGQKPFVYNGKTFVFSGDKGAALAFFLTLPVEQQGVFVRQVYFAELTAGGREYNDPTSKRAGSYLRGRAAIAALFPDKAADGSPISYSGDITMFSSLLANPIPTLKTTTDAGIRTDFGGNIQTLTPGGQTLVGVEGIVPGADSGLITQGSGDIQMYSKGSVLLGLSRIMTTFGGDIMIWSAEGDINAGRGAKTTVLYTPPRRVYDDYGNISLSPQVPSSGAGIATLNPIPEVLAGNIDLVAPLGTIDAGEAGIRVSGSVNLAALQIVNAGNIQAQGATTGLPTVQAPNIGGLTEASNVAGAAAKQAIPQQTAGNVQPSIIIVEVLGFGGGSGDQPARDNQEQRRINMKDQQGYDPNSMFQVVGSGELSEDQKKLINR